MCKLTCSSERASAAQNWVCFWCALCESFCVYKNKRRSCCLGYLNAALILLYCVCIISRYESVFDANEVSQRQIRCLYIYGKALIEISPSGRGPTNCPFAVHCPYRGNNIFRISLYTRPFYLFSARWRTQRKIEAASASAFHSGRMQLVSHAKVMKNAHYQTDTRCYLCVAATQLKWAKKSVLCTGHYCYVPDYVFRVNNTIHATAGKIIASVRFF